MENCKGCFTHTYAHNSCPQRFANRFDKCPCRICLVKGVCDDPCEEYEAFSDAPYKIGPDRG